MELSQQLDSLNIAASDPEPLLHSARVLDPATTHFYTAQGVRQRKHEVQYTLGWVSKDASVKNTYGVFTSPESLIFDVAPSAPESQGKPEVGGSLLLEVHAEVCGTLKNNQYYVHVDYVSARTTKDQQGGRPLTKLSDMLITSRTDPIIKIYSPKLIRGIMRLVPFWLRYAGSDRPKELVIEYPYKVLVEQWSELRRLAGNMSPWNFEPVNDDSTTESTSQSVASVTSEEDSNDTEMARQFGVLVDAVLPILDHLDLTPESCSCLPEECFHVPYMSLGRFFRPGTEVYHPPVGKTQVEFITKVESVEYQIENCALTCKAYVYTGTEYAYHSWDWNLHEFDGIRDLRLQPFRIQPVDIYNLDHDSKRGVFAARGLELKKLVDGAPVEMEYNGIAGVSTQASKELNDVTFRQYNGRVIVDPAGFLLSSYNKVSWFGAAHKCTEKELQELEDGIYERIVPITMGYSFERKCWNIVEFDSLSSIDRILGILATVVLGDKELAILRALATRPANSIGIWSADFIRGKGAGKIILLHGPPGVGKTYTVEALAEHFQRPLLPLTIADIGTAEENIEGRLQEWFELAQRLNAFILVDEADIFLERRRNSDLARNGIVTAFLRHMEYFTGLLFLTTNRVGQIDDAFVSRINVAIPFGPLDQTTSSRIWQTFFQKLERENKGRVRIGNKAKEWVLTSKEVAACKWNGREIRNAFHNALSLAEYDAAQESDNGAKDDPILVERDHFERVVEMSKGFQDYLDSIRQADMAKRAAANKDRNDYLGMLMDSRM